MDVKVFTQEDKRKCLAREVAMRTNAYPRFVARGKLKQEDADREIACMKAILKEYDAPSD